MTLWLLAVSDTVTPATRLRKATSFVPGSTLALQLAASVQLLVPAPPSQHTPVQLMPVSVRRNTLVAPRSMIAPLTPGGRFGVAKLPLAVPVEVRVSKLCPPSVKPLISVLFKVPPRVTLPAPAPATATWSYCVPAIVPPISASMVPVLVRLPVMVRMPATPTPPGCSVP